MQYDPKHPVAKEIQRKATRLYAFNNKVTFCWIPSHCGIVGNEVADKLARNASNIQFTKRQEAALPVVAKDLNSHINEQGKLWLQNKWDRECFDENNFENKLHFLDNKIGDRKFHSFTTRLDEIKYNRIRLGHTRETSKFYPAGELPPLCDFCNKPKTVKHFFTDCLLYAEARHRFFQPHHHNFTKILSRDSHENCQKVIKFLKYTQLHSQI